MACHQKVFRAFLAVLGFVAMFPITARGQTLPTVRDVAAADHVSNDTVGPVLSIRVLRDGRILVSDPLHTRIELFDADFGKSQTVQTFTREQTSVSLVPYVADSTLYLDPSSRTLSVLDNNGKIARVMALPHPEDAVAFAGSWSLGAPLLDSKGRLVYRGSAPTKYIMVGGKIRTPYQSDSAPLIRVDLDTRVTDTIAQLKVLDSRQFSLAEDANHVTTFTIVSNPFPKIDQWALVSDGSIAIVRAGDYRVDWIRPDDSQLRGDRLPYEWVRLTDSVKQGKLDSLKRALPNSNIGQAIDVTIPTEGGPLKAKQVSTWISAPEVSDYESSIGFNAVIADHSGRLWILPRNRSGVGDGLVYDVVDKDGKIVDRVRLPAGRALVGFGFDGSIYLTRVEKGAAFLERTRLK